MKRRDFIQQTSAGTALISLGGIGLSSFTTLGTKKITILHTNDVHSHIDPFGPEDGRNANKGGVARRASLIESIRKENPHTILLDAGDIFQGTPYFNYYGGELEFKLMSMLKYDAATIGNHDFDNGIDGLYAQLPHATFEFISANYDFSNTVMNSHVKPYKTFSKDGIKIGLFGLGIELQGLVDPLMFKETKYLDPIEITQDMTRILKTEEKCDLIICLSHLGYNYRNEASKISDLKLASLTKDIDLIIGGHTHTFLPKPTIVKNIVGKNILVNQVGCYGINLGKIDFYFDSDMNKAANGTSIFV
ncbi:MAG: bifunctional metallophosphatase/5'-nucleotidase [Flavobacteriales bacterium]|nr:bifunctional metallophosphatase/5'-nucleotidase [Flavobacteriia bacterium]NCP05631.1 bifunctional metallophosphatase/5'-nucleotidase [Flavobacteriales bacterium]PIV94705.1 MAG: metallophosphatase [Flavobacteriaceae bacterium CG17_big_fil_post_rev_8_21_14_2_50_33_15]PIY09701.1 MAG: metallophosphatase [Flavobacteriaceae bacterium CG_4_10_14_3_um_filter_33_47]PJB16587.1 MAG: metallophosphatase [Flavobacteriaceae bacterium CG_4_9_14_3_um_filter_33_16]